MTYQAVVDTFNRKYPRLFITKCIDYDKTHFVIEAVEDPTVPNYNDPYYGVDKRTGKITSFVPALDLEAFFDAVDNRTVYSTY